MKRSSLEFEFPFIPLVNNVHAHEFLSVRFAAASVFLCPPSVWQTARAARRLHSGKGTQEAGKANPWRDR